MASFEVEILYRTSTSCNGKRFPKVEADSGDRAYEQCMQEVKAMRRVMKIDGGDVIELPASH